MRSTLNAHNLHKNRQYKRLFPFPVCAPRVNKTDPTMRNDLMTNAISWSVYFTANTPAGGGRAWWSGWFSSGYGGSVCWERFGWGGGVNLPFPQRSMSVIEVCQLRSHVGALISQQAPTSSSITPSSASTLMCFLLIGLTPALSSVWCLQSVLLFYVLIESFIHLSLEPFLFCICGVFICICISFYILGNTEQD